MSTRDFHIGDVLSVTTGWLVSPRLIGGMYDILGFMTGEQLYTHQLPRAADECKPELLRQHPQLAAVDAPAITGDNWREWLADQVRQYGEMVSVAPLPPREPQYDTPIADLIEMVGDPTKIIVVDV